MLCRFFYKNLNVEVFKIIKKIEHVGIMAENLTHSVNFYVDLLGFDESRRGETKDNKQIVFLTHKGLPEFEIELVKDTQSIDTYSAEGLVNHLAFAVEDLEQTIKFLSENEVEFLANKPKMGIGRRTIRFKGPSGEILQLVEEKK